MRLGLVLLVGLAIDLAAGPVLASPCDATVAPAPQSGGAGYLPRRDDERCEGLFVSPVGAPPVEIVSMTRGSFGRDAGDVDRLTISLAANRPPGPVHVRAVGVPVSLFYRMDADLPPGRTLAWPLGDVVRPRHLAIGQLGVFAFSHTGDGGIVYLPVSVDRPSNAPDTSGGVSVVLRSSVDLGSPEWRFFVGDAVSAPFHRLEQSGGRYVAMLPPDTHGSGTLEVRWRNSIGTSQVRQFDLAI